MSGSPRSLRPSLWEWMQIILLCVNLTWTTLCLGGYRAGTMAVTSTLTAALLLAHAAACVAGATRSPAAENDGSMRRGAAMEFHPAGWLFVPFLVYAAANVAFVTPVRWLGWFDWFGWAQAVAVFWVVLNGLHSRIAERVVWAVLFLVGAASVVLACYQSFVAPDWLMLHRLQASQYAGRASGTFGIPNSEAAFLLLLLPIAGALALRRGASAISRVFFGWLATVLLFGLVLTISRGAWIGFALALVAWPLLGRSSSWRRRIGVALAIAVAVGVSAYGAYLMSPRVRERLDLLVHELGERSRPVLWRAGLKLVREHPVFGTGGGSFDVAFERHRPEGFLRVPQWAHNDYLNTLTDYGVVGFALCFGAAAIVIFQVRRRGRLVRAAVGCGDGRAKVGAFDDPVVRQAQAIGLLAFAFQLFVDFHFKIPALAMAFATSAGFAVRGSAWQTDPGKRPTSSAGRRFVAALCAVGAVAIVGLFVPRYRAESLRADARDNIDLLLDEPVDSPRFQGRLAGARIALDRAVVLAPDNAQAWADRSYTVAQMSRVEPKNLAEFGGQAEADADRAIALAPWVAEFWIRRGVARDMRHRWLEAGNDFIRAVQLSPNMPLPWYYYGYHLSLDPSGRDLAEAMAANCLRLDPNNRDGIRLRQQLAVGRTRP